MDAPPVAPSEAPFAPLVDTHAHLNDRRFAGDVADVLVRAQEHGICAMVVVGYDLESSRTAVRLAQRHAQVWAAVGIHPHSAKTVDAAALKELGRLSREPRVVALGECGLDFYRDLSPRDAQQRAFAAQLALAAEAGLPVIVHSREAMEQTLATLEHERLPNGGVMHCFDGTEHDARRVVALGMHISCAGPLTYRKDTTLANAIKGTPIDRLVVETDCPYLSPAGHRGERNEPAYVRIVAQAVADARGIPVEAVARQTSLSASQLFRTPEMALPRHVREQAA